MAKNVFETIAFTLLIIGGFNWGLVGVFDFNLVSMIFGESTILTRVVYSIVGVSSLVAGYFKWFD